MDRDRDGRVPLHHAAFENDVDAVADRIKAGDPPDAQDRLGFAPLHLAAQQGSIDAARVLLQHGAMVDITNSYGNTPLFVAVFNSRGRGDVIELLRAWGADPEHVNGSGQTPIGLARLIANFDVLRWFEAPASPKSRK